jgi:hypothetical protein
MPEHFIYELIAQSKVSHHLAPKLAVDLFERKFPKIDCTKIFNTLDKPLVTMINDILYITTPEGITADEWLILFNLGFVSDNMARARDIIIEAFQDKEFFSPIIDESFRARCDFTRCIGVHLALKFSLYRDYICDHPECYNNLNIEKWYAMALMEHLDNPVIWMRCHDIAVVWAFYTKYKLRKLPPIQTYLSHIDVCLRFSRDPAIYEDVMKVDPAIADFVKRNI